MPGHTWGRIPAHLRAPVHAHARLGPTGVELVPAELERALHCALQLAHQQGGLDKGALVGLARLLPGLAHLQAQHCALQQEVGGRGWAHREQERQRERQPEQQQQSSLEPLPMGMRGQAGGPGRAQAGAGLISAQAVLRALLARSMRLGLRAPPRRLQQQQQQQRQQDPQEQRRMGAQGSQQQGREHHQLSRPAPAACMGVVGGAGCAAHNMGTDASSTSGSSAVQGALSSGGGSGGGDGRAQESAPGAWDVHEVVTLVQVRQAALTVHSRLISGALTVHSRL